MRRRQFRRNNDPSPPLPRRAMNMSVQPGPPAPGEPGAPAEDVRDRIEAQLERIRDYIDAGKHADRAMLDDDAQTMPHCIALENRRDPGLNLAIAPSPPALLQLIKSMPRTFHLRCILRSSENTVDGAHHLFLDIKRETMGPLSILMIEPAHLRNNQNGRSMLLALLILMMPDPYFSGRRMSCFNVGAQMSGSDCLIFCIDFALKARRHEAQLATLHAIHLGGHAIGNDAADPAIDQNNADTLSLAPARLLPFSFFEHAQSTVALREVWGDDDERAIGQIRKIEAARSDGDDGKGVLSSIGQRRRLFLLDTLEGLAQQDSD
jgi:hypothetical protein